MHISMMRFFALNRRFPALFTGQGCYSCLALLVRLSAALSALILVEIFQFPGSVISVPYHSFCRWQLVLSSVRSTLDILLLACQCSSLLELNARLLQHTSCAAIENDLALMLTEICVGCVFSFCRRCYRIYLPYTVLHI